MVFFYGNGWVRLACDRSFSMLSYIFSGVVCKEYSRIHSFGGWDDPNVKALMIKFRLHSPVKLTLGSFSHEENRYPRIDLLIFGDNNYIGVYIRERVLHPEEVSPWYCIGYHDSCWRNTVQDFMFKFRDKFSTLDDLFCDSWYEVPEVSEEFVKKLATCREDARHTLQSLYPDGLE